MMRTSISAGHGLPCACLGDNAIFVRASSLKSVAPFAVSVIGGSIKEITDPSGTDLLSDVGVSVLGEITQEEPAEWSPDAKVVIKMDKVKTLVLGRGLNA